jgi:hypothetical protein
LKQLTKKATQQLRQEITRRTPIVVVIVILEKRAGRSNQGGRGHDYRNVKRAGILGTGGTHIHHHLGVWTRGAPIRSNKIRL